jgi:hypothetical protein
LPPLQAVQHAANFLARAFARDVDPTLYSEAYRTIIGSLSLEQQQQAATLAAQALQDEPPFTLQYRDILALDPSIEIEVGRAEGAFRVTVRYETGQDIDGDPVYSYRTAVVSIRSGSSRGQVVIAGLDALQLMVSQYGSDVPDAEPVDIEVLYEPFNLS